MPSNLLLISHVKEDLAFGRKLAQRLGYEYSEATDRDEARRILVTHPTSLVFWDAQNTAQYDGVMEILPKYAKPARVFALTEKSLFFYPHLYKQPIFGHYLHRRYDSAAISVYERLAAAALTRDPSGLARYLPEEVAIKEIHLERSTHKRAAIDAIQSALTKQGVKGRLSALVAQATDELLLNAIFDAPAEKTGKRPRRELSREADFELGANETVKVEVGYGPEYMGICVSDSFGSLTRKVFFDSLRKHIEKEGSASTKAKVAESGLGLHGIVKSGLSLVFISKPKVATQMILLFPVVESYKDFRTGFRFLSLLAD